MSLINLTIPSGYNETPILTLPLTRPETLAVINRLLPTTSKVEIHRLRHRHTTTFIIHCTEDPNGQ